MEVVADQAAAVSRPLRFTGPSPESKSSNFTEQGKDVMHKLYIVNILCADH